MLTEFNPLSVVQQVKANYKNFITSAFPLADEGLLSQFEDLIENEKLLWNGPFLTIARQYKQSEKTTKELFEKLDIAKEIADLLPTNRLFVHQEEAILSIKGGNHTIVATGTGSGKTESFIIPVLDYCLKHTNERGIKAIIVYPMNALANDQLDRLRHYLFFLNKISGKKITVGRYVGDTPEDVGDLESKTPLQRCPLWGELAEYNCTLDCKNRVLLKAVDQSRLVCTKNPEVSINFDILTRKALRESPPDILITNYVQLEYMLLRKRDSKVFDSLALKYLIFDEIHTYSGARGVEVSLLVRRLRERLRSLGAKKLQLVGTSATITSHQDEKQTRLSVSEFAGQFFGETVDARGIILETPKPFEQPERSYLPDQTIFAEQIDETRLEDVFSVIAPESETQSLDKSESQEIRLGRLIKGNQIFQKLLVLLSKKPERPEELIDILLSDESNVSDFLNALDENRRADYLWQLLYLSSIAADPKLSSQNSLVPLIRPQVHVFYKTLGQTFPNGELYGCTSRTCRKIYVSPRDRCDECGKVVEEMGVCRFCGEIFYRASFDRNLCEKSLGALETLDGKRGLSATRLSNKFVRGFGTPLWQNFEEPVNIQKGRKISKCLNCGDLSEKDHVCSLGPPDMQPGYVYDKLGHCPFCERSYGNQDAISSFYMSPNTTSRVVFDITYSELPDQLRKTLIFSDSRQDASYVAATIEDEHLTHAIRQLVYEVLSQNFRGYADANQIERGVIDKLEKWRGEGLDDKERDYFLIKIIEELASRAKQRSVESLGLVEYSYYGIHSAEDFKKSIHQHPNLVSFLTHKEIDLELFRKYLHGLLYIIRRDRALSGLEKEGSGPQNIPTGYSLNATRNTGSPSYELKAAASTRGSLTRYSTKLFGKGLAPEILRNALEFLRKTVILKEVQVGRYRDKTAGYVIDRGKLIAALPQFIQKCDSCQSTYNGTLPSKTCLYYSCKGTLTLRTIEAEEYYRDSKNFHLHFYRSTARRMIAEEDSGSLRSSERQKIENKFKSGQIDLIVSTPTLELGVDIGDLVSVGLAKSPPSPASYAQRTGRAGREKKIALTTAFQFQSPLDMYYFRNPKEIMSGVITPPLISLENRTIVDRHINSLLIEEVFVHSPFADTLSGNLKEFVDNSQQFEIVIQYLNSIRDNIKQKIERTFKDIPWLDTQEIDKRIETFPKLFSESLERFKREAKILNDIADEIYESRRALRGQVGKQVDEDRWRLSRMEANIEYRLSGFPEGLNSRDVLSHLSRTEIIPRYAFPGKAVQVVSDLQEEFGDRSAQIAVSELAPGMPLYMKKNIFEVLGFDFEQEPEGNKTAQFWVCKSCKLYATEIEPKSRTCPQCQSTKGFDRFENCIAPKLVIVDQKGRPSEEGREFIQANTDHFVLSPISLDESTTSNEFILSFAGIRALDLGVKEILTVTTSLNTPNGEQPFAICRKCGRLLKNFQEDKGHRTGRRRTCNGKPFVANLFHSFGTNVIALKIPPSAIPTQDVEKFLITLKNALISASELIVNAEEGEIDGVIKPDTQMIVLFDNIDGGVGYVKQIISRLDEVLVKAASRILLECDCESGCIKCLWAYRRKRDIANIDKRLVFDFFKQVEREYSEKRVEQNGSLKPYVGKKVISITSLPDTVDGALELRDRLLGAHGDIDLISLYVTDYPVSWPDGEASWVDVLCQCKRNGTKVTVIVREPNRPSHKRALNKLAKAGVSVMIYSVPVSDTEQTGIAHLKHALIDYGKETACAIHMTANLSPEVRKNVDTYDFGSGEENLEWIEGTFNAIKQVKSQAKLWSIVD